MKAVIHPGTPRGETPAPPSKSMAHRRLICAGLAAGKSVIRRVDPSEDILATADCLRALGAGLEAEGDTVAVTGCDPRKAAGARLECRESGSTLRFMIPLALLSGQEMEFTGSEKLFSRPLSVYEELCRARGFRFEPGPGRLKVCGKLASGVYEVPGNISSQFISGLLFALPLAEGDSEIRITGAVESRPYLDLTLQALNDAGVAAAWEGGNVLRVPGGSAYRAGETAVEGDYSNAAFLELLNFAGGRVNVTGLRPDSLQGDRVYREYFEKIRQGTPVLDVTDCPDLAPALIAAAAMSHGAYLTGTRRLKIKESDRGAAMAEEMAKFGVNLTLEENAIRVPAGSLRTPAQPLSGHNDHRIVMALTAVCLKTGGEITDARAVRKSLPDYWSRIAALGARAELLNLEGEKE